MVIQKELQKLYQQLLQDTVARIPVNGTDVTVRILEGSKLSLSTEVYFGGNFIPPSVRASLTKKLPATEGHIKTFFTIDEPNFRIYLNYLGHIQTLKNQAFDHLIEEFGWLAQEWRHFLDENDKHDLIHVRK
jgi:hypothetical protein